VGEDDIGSEASVSLDAIFELTESLSSRMMQDLHRELLQRLPLKTTPQQMAIAMILRRQSGRMTVTDVAREFGVSLSAVTASADRMSRLGILQRSRDEADRRVVWLDLTPAGREAVAVFLEVREQVRHRYFDLLSEQDRSDVYRVMSKVMDAADQRVQGAPASGRDHDA
jgi:DNA-binding MarR family transcriptional regulator